MTRMAITGGNGFVGSHVAERLRAAGAEIFEATMRVPLLSVAQVHILAEGAAEPAPFAPPPPEDLTPRTPFDDTTIRIGLPEPGPFTIRDLRWWPH